MEFCKDFVGFDEDSEDAVQYIDPIEDDEDEEGV